MTDLVLDGIADLAKELARLLDGDGPNATASIDVGVHRVTRAAYDRLDGEEVSHEGTTWKRKMIRGENIYYPGSITLSAYKPKESAE